VYLYLVRHGDAVSEDQDPQRPLSESGVRTARRIGTYLRESGAVSVAEIRHSTKTRARQTAEILAESGGLEAKPTEVPDMGPNADVEGMAAALSESPAEDLMLVGHLPYLSRLASLLVTGVVRDDEFEFETCGVLCLHGTAELGWSARWMLVPSLLPT
jgi:phosphohistidine phosphatase